MCLCVGLSSFFSSFVSLCRSLKLLPHNFCLAMWLLQCGFGCMRRRVQSWRRAVPAMDVDDVRCVHVSVHQACNGCVSESTTYALEGLNLEVCSSLCPWWFFLTPLALRPASCQVVSAPRRCVVSCAGIRILSQDLANPCVPSYLSYLRSR